jgi:hypothetical protein
MRGKLGRIGQKGGFVAPLLALLLLFRLLIPTGYMIVADHEGKPGLALCGVQAPAAAAPERHGGHDGHDPDRAPPNPGDRPCPYAALAAPPLPPSPPAVRPRAPVADLPPFLAPRSDSPRVAPASPPPPARGPPILV